MAESTFLQPILDQIQYAIEREVVNRAELSEYTVDMSVA